MSVVSVLVGIVLLAALAAAVSRPWWRPAVAPAMLVRQVRQWIMSETVDPDVRYQELVAAIRDLDFDYRVGVVTEADYQMLRAELVRQAVAVMQRLERSDDREADLKAQVEAIEAIVRLLRTHRHTVAMRAADGQTPLCPACNQPVQAGTQFCAHCGAKLNATCPDCGNPIETPDRFCAACGRRLAEEGSAV